MKQLTVLLTSLSLMFSPLAALPVQAQDLNALRRNLSELEDLFVQINELQARTIYGKGPSLNPQPRPTLADVTQYQLKVMQAKEQLQKEFLEHLRETKNSQDLLKFVNDINIYFEAAKRIEGLKIYMEEKVEPESWETMYGLVFPIENLAQHPFLLAISIFSKNFADLPGVIIDFNEIKAVITRDASFLTEMRRNGQGWELVVTLNKSFVTDYDISRLVDQPSTTNVLKFSLLQLSHVLYESLAASFLNLRRQLSQLPEVPAAMRERFVSMKVKRELLLDKERKELYGLQKPALMKALNNTLAELEKSGASYVCDDEFLAAFDRLRNMTREEGQKAGVLAEFRKDEAKNFESALSALLLLMPLNNWAEDVHYAVAEAKRMALHWQFLVNPREEFQMSDEARAEFTALIDRKARQVADKVAAQPKLLAELQSAQLSQNLAGERSRQRSSLHSKLVEESRRLKRFESEEINLSYLMEAQAGAIKGLDISANVAGWLKAIKAQPKYELGHQLYRQILAQYLAAFQFDEPIPNPLRLNKLFQMKKSARWNPSAVKDKVEAKYYPSLEKSGTRRIKDLNDFITIGQLLKFDKYEVRAVEKVGEENGVPVYMQPAPNVRNLDVRENWILPEWLSTSERAAYLSAMKNDLLTSAPLLGAYVGNEQVWQKLAAFDPKTGSWKSVFELVEGQLLRVERQVLDNMQLVEKEIRNLPAQNNPDLGGVSEELRTLIGRSTALNMSLTAFATFESYFDDIRQELLTPGWWRQRWESAADYTSKVWLFAAGLFLAQLLLGRITTVARGVESVSSILVPLLGGNFSRISYVFWGMFGVTVGVAAYRGWGPEATRAEILRKFYECGVDSVCAAKYGDLSRQESIRDAARFEAGMNVAVMVLLQAGIFAIAPVRARIVNRRYLKQQDELKPYRDALGMDEQSNFSLESIQRHVNEAMARVASNPDPLVRAQVEAYIRQAQYNLESAIWTEAKRWQKIGSKYKRYMKGLGLNESNWARPDSLNNAWMRLQLDRNAGRVSAGEFRELEHGLRSMYAEAAPMHQRMLGDSLMRNYMSRVWDSAGVGVTDLKASLDFFKSQVSQGLFQSIEEQYGMNQSQRTQFIDRVEQLVEGIAKDYTANPAGAQSRIRAFVKQHGRGA